MILPATLSSKNSVATSSASSPLEVTDSKSNTNTAANNHNNNTMNGSPMSISTNPTIASNLSPTSTTTTTNHHHHHHHRNHNNENIITTPTTTTTTSSPNTAANDRAGCSTVLVDCAGCGSTILDRYYLSSVDQHWHAACLKCSQCKLNLQAEPSCFSRDGLIFCKSDYYRLFTMRRCNRCGEGIYASELVMRVKDHNVYHIQCFTCAWCNVTLSQGDLYGIRDNLVYCRQHFEMLSASSTTTLSSSSSSSIHVSTGSSTVPPSASASASSCSKLSSQLYSLGVMAPSDVVHRQQHYHHHLGPASSPPSIPPPSTSLALPLPGPPPSSPGHHFHHVHHSPHHGYHPHAAHHHNHSALSLPSVSASHHAGHHHHHHHLHHSHPGAGSPPMHLNDTNMTGDQCSTMAATPYTTNPGNLQGGGVGIDIYSPLSIANLSGTSGGPMTPNGSNITNNNSSNNNNCTGNNGNNNSNGSGHHNGQSPTTPQSIRKGRPRKRKNVINHNNQHHTNNHHHLGSHGHHHGPPQPSQPQDNDTIMNSCAHETSTLSPSSVRNAHSPNGVSNTLDGGPLSGLAASIENSCNSQLSSSSSSVLNLVTHSSGGNGNSGGGGGGSQRTKRMRTSFKHHQLRTMKTYFSVNQNPDAKDLKQLAQKTGLSKRVLQVWFQNARAKWRRNNLKMLPDAQELSLNGQTMLNLGHPSTPSSTMIGSPNGSTRPYSSPSPVMSPSTTDTLSHHQPSPMIVATGGCVTPNNNSQPPPVVSNVKTPSPFISGHGPPPPPLPPPPNLAGMAMNFQELY